MHPGLFQNIFTTNNIIFFQSKFGNRLLAALIGSLMIIPVYLMVLYTDISPIPINVLFGVDYVLVVVSTIIILNMLYCIITCYHLFYAPA